MENLVSIIVPIYNAEQVLEQGIHCLTQQTYQNLEIILVDDCSSDCSYEKCLQLAEKDSRIKVYKQTHNQGAGAARNKGMEVAQGRYLTFFDADDRCKETLIEDNVLIAQEYQCDIVMWGAYPVTNEQNICEVSQMQERAQNLFVARTQEECRKKWLELKFYSGNVYIGAPWNKLYEREFLQRNHLIFPDTRRMQDSIFNVQCFHMAKTFAVNSQKYSYYFYNSQEVFWKKIHPSFINDVVTYCKEIKTTIESWNLDTEDIKVRLDNEFFGFLYCAMEACRNPKWKLSFVQKISYLKDVLANDYVSERMRCFSVSDEEYILFSKLCQTKLPLLILVFVYLRPMYYKVRRACGRVIRKMLGKTR